MSYYTKRGKTHFVQTVEDKKAACGISCENINNVTIHPQDVTCSRCQRMMAGKKPVEDGEDWDDYSLSCAGRRTHRW